MKIKSARIQKLIHSEDVRQMCISNQFYTRGDCKAYDELLEVDGIVTDKKLMWMANDIFEHSDVDRLLDEYDTTDEKDILTIIFTGLLDICLYVVDKVEVE